MNTTTKKLTQRMRDEMLDALSAARLRDWCDATSHDKSDRGLIQLATIIVRAKSTTFADIDEMLHAMGYTATKLDVWHKIRAISRG